MNNYKKLKDLSFQNGSSPRECTYLQFNETN